MYNHQRVTLLFACIAISSLTSVHSSPLSLTYDINGVENSTEKISFVPLQEESQLNMKPIIGILSVEFGETMNNRLQETNQTFSSYIAASYVKSVESAGARIVPIMINGTDEYYEMLANSLNGFLFPGGSTSLNSSGYGRAGDILYQHILASQTTSNPLALWGTCLGFQMLVYLAADRQNPKTLCGGYGRADPLYFTEKYNSSRMFSTATPDLIEATQTQNITPNYHEYCVLPETFNELNVDIDYNVLSTNYDDDGTEYVSTIEHKQFPIFGTQWHPEKPSYEWSRDTIPHTTQAIRLQYHVMEVFIGEARRNANNFSSIEEESSHLIYNYPTTYNTEYSLFTQYYFF